LKTTPENKIHYTLRVASAMCFIGHGTFGILMKPIWSNYFGVFGIGHDLSYRLMPILGTVDIIMGLILLFYPLRALLTWLIIWGVVTALLRPLSGEPFGEFVERAGNFGAPLALIILSGGFSKNIKHLFTPVNPNIQVDAKTLARLKICLQSAIFLLLLGHGWLNLIEKQSLVDQYRSLGFINPATTAQIIGLVEIIGALTVLIRPMRSIVLALFIWKITSELFYPHYELFEFIERGGSYGTLLALWFVLEAAPSFRKTTDYSRTKPILVNDNQETTNNSSFNN